jgi:alpha-N-arabinofuranosidase
MYAPHQSGQAVRANFSAPSVSYDRDGKPATFWGLKGSASLRDKDLTITVVNPHVSEVRNSRVTVRGAKIKSASATVLTHSDMHAHNTFSDRNVVVPKERAVSVGGDDIHFEFPAASVTKLSVRLT